MSIRGLGAIALLIALPPGAQAQQGGRAQDTVSTRPVLTAGEADGEPRRRQLIPQLAIDLGFTTMQLGGGFLYEVGAFVQDSASLEQISTAPLSRIRDARVLLGGKFDTRRSFTWQLGVMRDFTTSKWLVRQSGLMLAVPEISSHFFVGRAKEGFSQNKVMVGYDGWSMERMPFTDATIPILADGLKWLGSVKDNHFFWNLGFFTDVLSEGQTFSSYEHQVVLRAGWVPLVADSAGTLLHLALNLRHGKPLDDSLRLRSRPEAFTAPYYIDTGKFAAESSQMIGPEIYYRPGRVLLGLEYYWQHVNTPDADNVWFHGGEAVLAWLVTGETRSYNTVGHYFRAVSPDSTVVQGGPGAWELVFKLTYADLADGHIDGGIFWRFTPMLNWHLTDNVRLEMAYGFGVLDRFGIKGDTHFFQSRLQLQL